MKNPQNNTIALPALLRRTSSINTLETNSLCCEAAGIIASASAIAEALIPHEKLRRAALVDAALNAQERPPAQPVLGFIRKLGLRTLSTSANPLKNLAESFTISFHGREIRLQFVHIFPSEYTFVGHGVLKNPAGIADALKCFEHRLQGAFTYGLGDCKHQSLMNTFHSPESGRSVISFMKPLTYGRKYSSSLLNNTFSQKNGPAVGSKLRIARRAPLKFMSVCRDHKSPKNCTYRPDCLHPSRSVIGRPIAENQYSDSSEEKCSRRGKHDFQKGIGFEANFRRKHLWLLAITQSVSVNKTRNTVYGGMA